MTNFAKEKIYKYPELVYFSNLQIVSMIPGDRKVAGCYTFSNNSFVENIFILDCSLNAFSSDQIGQLLSDNDSAKYGASLSWGDNFLASVKNSWYSSFNISSISSLSVERVNSNSPIETLENFSILSFSDLNSSKIKYGEINLQFLFNKSLVNCLLIESFLKNENNMLASTINSFWSNISTYNPCLFATRSLRFDANFSTCSSVNVDFDIISSNMENLTSLVSCLTNLASAIFNLGSNSEGTSSLTTISSIFLSGRTPYKKLSVSNCLLRRGGKK